jgi:hypothetical protein
MCLQIFATQTLNTEIMKINIKKSALLLLGVAVFSSCEQEDPLVGTTQTLECDYFTQDRVLVDDPDVTIDYLITCDMDVSGDITVMPGVTIAFATDAGISVSENGSFKAEGTALLPILFTGEDGVKGSWRGILIDSNDPKNVFDHCVVEHAGGIAHNSNGDKGAFVIWAESKATITNSIIRKSLTNGINAVYSNSLITLGGNTMTTNDGAPMLIDVSYVGIPTSLDSYSGNGNPRIMVRIYSHTVSENTTWHKVDVDYQISGGPEMQVRQTAVLTIEPGVKAYFDAGCSLQAFDQAAIFAEGTVNEPIVFSGTNAANGAWGGIYFNYTSNTQNSLRYVKVEYAGGADFDGAIQMWARPKLTVQNSEILNSASCAFWNGGATGNPNLTVTDVVFTNNTGGDYCEN